MDIDELTSELSRAYASIHDAAHHLRCAERLVDGAARDDLSTLRKALRMEGEALETAVRRHIPGGLVEE